MNRWPPLVSGGGGVEGSGLRVGLRGIGLRWPAGIEEGVAGSGGWLADFGFWQLARPGCFQVWGKFE
jgi:hypothetical protein